METAAQAESRPSMDSSGYQKVEWWCWLWKHLCPQRTNVYNLGSVSESRALLMMLCLGRPKEVVQFQKQTLTSIFLTVGSCIYYSDAKKLFALTPLQILGGLAPAEPAPVFQRKIQSKPEEDELNLEDAEELVSLTEDRQVMDTASAVCSVSGPLIGVRPLQFFSSTSLWLIASQAVRRREGHWMFHNNNGGSLQPLGS